jgi:hypothetical protein
MLTFKREDFKIDLVFPVAQTVAAALIATQVIGRLGHFAFSIQTAVLLGAVGTKIAAIAERHYRDSEYIQYIRYAAIPVGVLAALPVHLFFYPAIPLAAIISVKGFIVLSGVLAAIRYASDHIPSFKSNEREAESVTTL